MMKNQGAIAAILVVIVGIVILAAVIMLSRRKVLARTAANRATGTSNPWVNFGSLLGGAIGGAASSWKPGSGTPPVGGKQVMTQTGDWNYQGVPISTYPRLNPTSYPDSGYVGGQMGQAGGVTPSSNFTPISSGQHEAGSRSLYDQAIAEGYSAEEASVYLSQ